MPIRDPELEIKRPAKHVEACVESIQDRGSTPLASTPLITVMEGLMDSASGFLSDFLPNPLSRSRAQLIADL